MRSLRRVMGKVCALALFGAASVGYAAEWNVISWAGNAPGWNQKLGVGEERMGCSSAPSGCLQALDREAKASGVSHITLAITPDPEKIAGYALEYSAGSLQENRLRGIGLDDALSVFGQWQRQGRNPGTVLQEVLTNTKAKNPQLEFGVTVYEDELGHPILRGLPPNVRTAVDRVELYLHYRQDGPRYKEYVEQARSLFPKAAIVAGIYPYDRIDYVPCAATPKTPCTPDDEKRLFEEALRLQVGMMVNGEVLAIEFYPGNFGTEDNWGGWQKPAQCRSARVQSCIATTRDMHATALQVLDSFRK